MASGEGPNLLGKIKFSCTIKDVCCNHLWKKSIACHFKISSAVAASIFSQVSFTAVEVCGSSVRKACICLSQKHCMCNTAYKMAFK